MATKQTTTRPPVLRRNRLHLAVQYALLTGAAAALSGPAQAQEDDVVLVTGSRIPRANLTAPTAVTTIDNTVIEQSGLINVADILRTVPSFGASTLSAGNSNFLTASSGINTLQLRNLEEDRTLVLVNGRRWVSGVAGSAAVDFNTIPLELIERVEVITGGASAVYGSDALAGVINVILKDDFEGVGLNYQTGGADAGGDIQKQLMFTVGGNFADDRGNAVVSLGYTDQRGLLSRDRPNTAVDDIAQCAATGVEGTCQIPLEPFFSSFSEYGRFFVPSTGASFTVNTGTGPTGTVVPWSTALYGFNRQHFRRYTVPTERYLLSSVFDYDMGGGVNAFVEATFTQTRTESELEPFPHSNSDLNFPGIPVTNPFVPPAIAAAVTAAGDTNVEYFRRMTEVGQRGASATRNTYRLVGGFEGELANGWNWDAYYNYGRMDDSQQGGGQINVLNMREALNAIDGDGNPATFDPICANPAARAEGCEPINIFGLGSISADAADYVRAPTSRQQLTQQETFGASLGGPFFMDRDAGPVEFVFGLERRTEEAEDVPDVLTQAGLNAGNAEAPIIGEYDVEEAFVELEVPLLSGRKMAEDLSFGAAYRYSDYSTIDTTNAWAYRLSWAPVESVRFRAQVSQAVRAPNVAELFAPGGENFAPVSDPCNGVTAATPGDIAANCRSIPEIAARIAATGSFTLTQTEIQGTGGFTSRGNPNLSPETSDSWSFGTVIDRDFGASGSWTLSVDYFTIEIEDLIDIVARQTSVSSCYNVPASTFPNQFCGLLVRDTTGPAFQLGELEEVNSGYINEGTLETEGIDLSLLFGFELGPGQASIRMNHTHLLDFTQTKFGAPDDLLGETGYAEDKSQLAFVYSPGRWNVEWEVSYMSDSVPDKSVPLFDFGVGDYVIHDFQVQYGFGEGNTRVYAGVNNAFDEEAPIILSGVPGNTTGTDTDATVYNPIGRAWYAGMRMSFGGSE